MKNTDLITSLPNPKLTYGADYINRNLDWLFHYRYRKLKEHWIICKNHINDQPLTDSQEKVNSIQSIESELTLKYSIIESIFEVRLEQILNYEFRNEIFEFFFVPSDIFTFFLETQDLCILFFATENVIHLGSVSFSLSFYLAVKKVKQIHIWGRSKFLCYKAKFFG